MKELNETELLEAQLRSWTPRHPSAILEKRLFHYATTGPRPATLAGWLAPVAACLLFVGFTLNPKSAPTLSGSPKSHGIVALILSNQSYAAYLPGSFERTHNQLETFAFDSGFLSPTNLIR